MDRLEGGKTSGQPAEGPSLRAQLVAEAVKSWSKDLVDLGGRNNLLYYRDLRTGTLDLGGRLVDAAARTRLLEGSRVSLSALFPDPDAQKDAARRARAIRARHRTNVEERGLETLKLGFGMATWRSERSSGTPNSPVLLWSVEAIPRGTTADDFDLEVSDEPELNPVLLNLLAAEFGVALDPERAPHSVNTPTAIEDFNSACAWLRDSCGAVPGFAVVDRTVLGNFSYAKLPLVRDLEQAGDQIAEHTLLAAIAGDPDARAELRERHSVATDDHLVPIPPPNEEFLILDADSSQSRVIAAVLADADLVVEGPPGTGKSQTIANLIATLVARGKSVLFVAEKRAAIEAVADRLRRVGLEDVLLDMHDGPTNRRRTAEALGAALEAVRIAQAPDTQRIHLTLSGRAQDLDQYASAIHTAVEPWGVTPHQVIERMLGTDEANRTSVRLRGVTLDSLTNDRIEAAREQLRAFVSRGGLQLLARPDEGWGPTFAGRRATDPGTVQLFANWLDEIEDGLPAVRKSAREAAARAALRSPDSVAEVETLLRALRYVNETLEHFEVEIFAEDLVELENGIGPARRGAVGRLFAVTLQGSYRSARRRIQEHLKGEAPGAQSLPEFIAQARESLDAWAQAGEGLPSGQIDTAELVERNGAVGGALVALTAGAEIRDATAESFEELESLMAELRRSRDQLLRLPELDQLYQSLCGSGFSSLIDQLSERQPIPDAAAEALEYVWLASLYERMQLERPALTAFDSESHETAIEEFIAADQQHIESTPARVRRAWAERATEARNQHPEEAALVAREARKKRKHLPTRELFDKAQEVLTAVKPCWVMSPLVVPQILPRETCFDVVVFDEASQVMPADAVSSLLRGRRAVVAGDPHQLPPTAFFASSVGEDEEDDGGRSADDDGALNEALDSAVVEGFQSILDVMGALLPAPYGRRTLQWHYRSRDERLITFSNAQKELYDWSMTTFPGALGEECLRFDRVDFRPTAGQPLSSPDREVERVVELILEHARARPDVSLGVIAFGITHANRIEEELRLALGENPELAGFFDESVEEPFFVKNLERVQGDERESIILTIGYGRTADGRLRYAFGPINQEGGERRLNVAITRARSQMTVVSSVSGRELDPDRVKSVGARMLRDYLLYVESGGRNLGLHQREKPILNPFERDIERALTEVGLNLISQFGASGYWIDFAVMHPDRPSEPVLAIEADGATYHSAPSARDRDRLRQQHLENLGWRFHRIWSTEWFKNREQEIADALEAAARAVSDRDSDSKVAALAAATTTKSLDDAPLERSPTRDKRPSVPRGRSISSLSSGQVRSMVRWVKSDGLLRTDEELLDEVSRELGYSRKGKRILDVVGRAIRAEADRPATPAPIREAQPSHSNRSSTQRPARRTSWPQQVAELSEPNQRDVQPPTAGPLARGTDPPPAAGAQGGALIITPRDVRLDVDPGVSVSGAELEVIRQEAFARRPQLLPGEMELSDLRMGNLQLAIRWSRDDFGKWLGVAHVSDPHRQEGKS